MGECNRRLHPELRLAVGVPDMNVYPALLAREERGVKAADSKDDRTHPGLGSRKDRARWRGVRHHSNARWSLFTRPTEGLPRTGHHGADGVREEGAAEKDLAALVGPEAVEQPRPARGHEVRLPAAARGVRGVPRRVAAARPVVVADHRAPRRGVARPVVARRVERPGLGAHAPQPGPSRRSSRAPWNTVRTSTR